MLNKISIPEYLPVAIHFGQVHVDSPATFSQVSADIVLNQNNLLIPNNIWTARIQDKGGSYEELGSKCYKQNKLLVLVQNRKKPFFLPYSNCCRLY